MAVCYDRPRKLTPPLRATSSPGLSTKIPFAQTPVSLYFGFCCSVAKLCPTLFKPIDCSTPGSSVLHCLWSLFKFRSIESVKPSNHLILGCPLLLLPSVFPSIRVFSSASAFHIRWPKDWSFSFSISPSNEFVELISFGIDRFDLLAIHWALKRTRK